MDNLSYTICNIFQKYLDTKYNRDEVTNDFVINRENGIDSLGLMNVIVEVEILFDIELDDYMEDIINCNTIGDFVNMLQVKIFK